jgi:uncharacterized protein YodC (DUF2158 family)
MPQMNLKQGDLVRLRSGGPVMTAGRVYLEARVPFARCTWSNRRGRAREAAFNLCALDVVEPREIEP